MRRPGPAFLRRCSLHRSARWSSRCSTSRTTSLPSASPDRWRGRPGSRRPSPAPPPRRRTCCARPVSTSVRGCSTGAGSRRTIGSVRPLWPRSCNRQQRTTAVARRVGRAVRRWLGRTLATRFVGVAGIGVVRGKSGTLTGVSALAGLLRDHDGRLLLFSIVAEGSCCRQRAKPQQALETPRSVCWSNAAAADQPIPTGAAWCSIIGRSCPNRRTSGRRDHAEGCGRTIPCRSVLARSSSARSCWYSAAAGPQ